MSVDLWEVLSNGSTRRIQDMNSEGTLGISLPREAITSSDAAKGDDVPVQYIEDEQKVEIYLP